MQSGNAIRKCNQEMQIRCVLYCVLYLLTLFYSKLNHARREKFSTYKDIYMFATLFALQIDNIDLVRTLHSFHIVQAAMHKEECNGFHTSVPVLAC